MPLPIGDVMGILADNLRLRKSVMPLSTARATAWARGLDIPRGGECVLYTGLMYQLMPSIASLQGQLAMLQNSWITRFMGLGRIANKIVNTSRIMARPDAKEQQAYDGRLRNIARLLQKAGVEFGYLYEQELYAGALICDLGVNKVFEEHARAVYDMLKREGVRRVITVDPHTTDMLHDVFPTIIEGYDLEVRNYLEVLVEAGLEPVAEAGLDVAVHDSCVYARYLSMLSEPRTLLEKAAIRVAEPEQAGKLTQCCGGPVEALYPDKAKAFAKERLDQLKSTGCSRVTTMCPICLQNLRHACNGDGVEVRDISEYLAEAYCPESSAGVGGAS